MCWIDKLTIDDIISQPIPIANILTDSFYYPSCGFDGGIVKDCNTKARDFNIQSFIYSDYATGQEAFEKMQNTFVGYQILGSRNVTQAELTPSGWQPHLPPNFNKNEYLQYKEEWKKPFANWTVYERNEDKTELHGPKRFSVLYIGGEGVATFQALYWTHKISPKAIAIIQPGTAFGLNWTNFTKKDGHLAWAVNNNPAGLPNYIYYGGYTWIGNFNSDFDWENYNQIRKIEYYYTDITRYSAVYIYERKLS